MIKILINFYNNLELGLGIKPYFNRLFTWINKHFQRVKTKSWNYFDTYFLLKLHYSLQKYFYQRIKFHYGIDYRWGDELSQNIDSNTFSLGYGSLQYNLVRNQKSKSILSIGSMYGFIPYMLSKACEDNGCGQVHFVDAGYNINQKKPHSKHFFGQGFWKKTDSIGHFDYLLKNKSKLLNLYVMTSQKFVQKYSKLMFDYIYLDGDHSYQGAKRDIARLWPKLELRGYLIIHDISYDKPDSVIKIEMKKIWAEILKNHDSNQKLEFTNNYSGLGVIKKTTQDLPLKL